MDILQVIAEELQIKKGQVEKSVELIDEGATIPYITSNSTRLRKVSEEDAKGTEYWLRSPDSNYSSYYLYVDATGNVTSWTSTMDNKGVAIMLSI